MIVRDLGNTDILRNYVLWCILRSRIAYTDDNYLKYRKVKKPSMHDLMKMKLDFEREEQNMLILRHPYLTIEQSHGHMKHEKKGKKFFDKIYEMRKQEFEKEITIAERLAHLRVTEAWD